MNKKQTRGNIAPDHHLWGCRGLRIARWIICVISKEQKTLTTTCLLRKTFLALLMVHAHMQYPSKCVKCKPLYPQVQFWEAVDCFSNPNIVFFFRRQRLVSHGCKRTGFFVPLLFLLQVSFTRETHIQTRIFFPYTYVLSTILIYLHSDQCIRGSFRFSILQWLEEHLETEATGIEPPTNIWTRS